MIDQIAARHKLAVARIGLDPSMSTMDNPPRSFKLLGRELKLLKDVGPQLAAYKSNTSLIYALSPISAVGVVLWNDRQDSYARVVASFTTSHVFALDNMLTLPFDARALEKELDQRLAKLSQYRQRVKDQLFLDAHQIGARIASESNHTFFPKGMPSVLKLDAATFQRIATPQYVLKERQTLTSGRSVASYVDPVCYGLVGKKRNNVVLSFSRYARYYWDYEDGNFDPNRLHVVIHWGAGSIR